MDDTDLVSLTGKPAQSVARMWSGDAMIQPQRPMWQHKARKAYFSKEKKQKTFILFCHAMGIKMRRTKQIPSLTLAVSWAA
jgi:gluconate kinase